MLSQVNRDTVSKHSVLKVEVSQNRRLKVTGNWSVQSGTQPAVISFVDDQGGVRTIYKQAKWRQLALK